MEDIVIAARQLTRSGAVAGGDEPEVRAPHHVARFIIPEVKAGEPPGGRGSPLPLRPDDEALISGLRDEGQSLPVRAPVHARHAVLERRELPWLSAVEREDPRLRDRGILPDRGAHECQAAAIWRDRRRAVPDVPAGELARSTAAIRAGPQVRDVVVAGDASGRVDDRLGVGGEAEGLERNLRSDEGSG